MEFPHACLLVFAKAPVAGQVKTRLVPHIGAETAAQFQHLMIQHTVSTAVHGALCPVQLFCTPDTAHPLFQQLRMDYPLALHVQQGEDLGERMFNAANQAMEKSRQVVIIGCDCLQLSERVLNQALTALSANGEDAVVIPAYDGGYVLIGMNRLDYRLFRAIDWGTERVMDQTRQALRQLSWSWRELPMLRDVDSIQDIAHIKEHGYRYHLDTGIQQLLSQISV